MEDYLVDDAIAATAYLFGDLVVVREEVSEVSLDLVVLVRLRDLGLLGIGSHHHLLLLFLLLFFLRHSNIINNHIPSTRIYLPRMM